MRPPSSPPPSSGHRPGDLCTFSQQMADADRNGSSQAIGYPPAPPGTDICTSTVIPYWAQLSGSQNQSSNVTSVPYVQQISLGDSAPPPDSTPVPAESGGYAGGEGTLNDPNSITVDSGSSDDAGTSDDSGSSDGSDGSSSSDGSQTLDDFEIYLAEMTNPWDNGGNEIGTEDNGNQYGTPFQFIASPQPETTTESSAPESQPQTPPYEPPTPVVPDVPSSPPGDSGNTQDTSGNSGGDTSGGSASTDSGTTDPSVSGQDSDVPASQPHEGSGGLTVWNQDREALVDQGALNIKWDANVGAWTGVVPPADLNVTDPLA